MKNNSLSANLKSLFTRENAGVLALLFMGVLLRLRQYLTGRSLWIDEAMLALNIVNRDFAGLFKPLDYDQGTPLGFLLVEKFFNFLLGKNELVLRLFPLLVGMAALGLFYLLLQRTTARAGLLLALALFAFNPRLVYYSSEVKQYILDVAVIITLLIMVAPLFKTNPAKKDFIGFALVGMVALWFSHPALFGLAGIGLTLVLVYSQRRDYASLKFAFVMGFAWVINLALFYWLVLQDLQQNDFIHGYWQGAFVPMPPWSDLGWYVTTINQNISLQFGMPYVPLFVFGVMVVGWIGLWQQKREYALVCAAIVFVTLTASALQVYPVVERMVLFLIPIGLLLLGNAADVLAQRLSARPVLNFGIFLLLGFYLLYGPVTTSLEYFIQPKYYEHMRPALAYIQEKAKPGDVVYVTNGALPAFRFYAPGYGLDTLRYESSARDDYQQPQLIQQKLATLKGQRRVWVLMSHVYETASFNEQDFILAYLNQQGTLTREIRKADTSVYLYLYNLQMP